MGCHGLLILIVKRFFSFLGNWPGFQVVDNFAAPVPENSLDLNRLCLSFQVLIQFMQVFSIALAGSQNIKIEGES